MSETAKHTVFIPADERRLALSAIRKEAAYQRGLSTGLGDASTATMIGRVHYHQHQLTAALLDMAADRLAKLDPDYRHPDEVSTAP
jgi:hypothetical protein